MQFVRRWFVVLAFLAVGVIGCSDSNKSGTGNPPPDKPKPEVKDADSSLKPDSLLKK